MSFNSTYKIPKDASYVTLRNQNRMLYANYSIQQYNVRQGCQVRAELQNGGVADADMIPKLLEGAIATTVAERTADIASEACPVTAVIVNPYASDKIYQSLTTSAAAYTAAAAGTWVSVTSTEYSALQTNVATTNVAGLATSILSTITGWGFANLDFLGAITLDTNTYKIPANTYVYAFAIRIKTSPTTTLDSFNVYGNKSTGTTSSGFVKIGSTLPALSAGLNYFVLKGQNAINGATDGLLGVTAPGNASVNLSQSYHLVYSSSATGTSFSYTSGVTLPITSSTQLLSLAGSGWVIAIQALATPTVQWVT